MALLLHAVSTAGLTVTQQEQLKSLGLQCYISPPLSGLVTTCDAAFIKLTSNDRLLAYSQLIEAARAVTDIIPIRYGSVFDDLDMLHQNLRQHCGRFIRQLKEISGCVEMSVRISANSFTEEIPTPANGREYLKLKQQHIHHCRTTYEAITESVSGCYVKSKIDDASPNTSLVIHFLVESTQIEQFKTAIHSFKLPQLFLSGPWAAYNFVK